MWRLHQSADTWNEISVWGQRCYTKAPTRRHGGKQQICRVFPSCVYLGFFCCLVPDFYAYTSRFRAHLRNSRYPNGSTFPWVRGGYSRGSAIVDFSRSFAYRYGKMSDWVMQILPR